jgi:hypothetical protein
MLYFELMDIFESNTLNQHGTNIYL